jgi:hypothetical protein
MAWFALATEDRSEFVCTADPCVESDAAETELVPAPTPAPEGATVYTLRPLSWAESQQFEALEAAEQISAVIKLGLCAVDGSEETAAQVAANPHPAVAVPLYAAIMRLTWGAPFSQGQTAGLG